MLDNAYLFLFKLYHIYIFMSNKSLSTEPSVQPKALCTNDCLFSKQCRHDPCTKPQTCTVGFISRADLRASQKTRLIKEKTDRCGSCKKSFRRRAFALQGRLTKQMSCIAVFFSKGLFRDALNIIAPPIKPCQN